MVRAWSDGNVEAVDTREGEDGFVVGVFEDGTTFTTEVPNVVWGLQKKKRQQGAGPPCGYWAYKDKSWGAWLAKVAMRRRGKKGVPSLALS